MIGSGALLFMLLWGPLNGRPLWISKLNTLLQLSYLMGIVLHQAYGWPASWFVTSLGWATGASILASGYTYMNEFTLRALRIAGAASPAA
jgi:hypothetical protein